MTKHVYTRVGVAAVALSIGLSCGCSPWHIDEDGCVAGNFQVASDYDFQVLSQHTCYKGFLAFSGVPAATLASGIFDHIEVIESLLISNSVAVSDSDRAAVVLPKARTVEYLWLGDNEGIGAVVLPIADNVQSVALEGNIGLTSISLPEVRKLDDLNLIECPDLTEIDMSRLEVVGPNDGGYLVFQIRSVPADIRFPSLRQVVGTFVLSGLLRETSDSVVDMPELQEVNGRFELVPQAFEVFGKKTMHRGMFTTGVGKMGHISEHWQFDLP